MAPVAVFFAVEFLDELVFGVREAAWPAIRGDLRLSYVAVGLLLTVPAVVAGVLEPLLGVLADAGRRRTLIVTGGAGFAGALLAIAIAPGAAVLLAAFAVLYPASGAFVSLTEATLMDLDPERREHNMVRWVLAGSVGVVAGPLLFAGALALGWSWRALFAGLAALTVPLLLWSRTAPQQGAGAARGAGESMRRLVKALRTATVLRWLLVLAIADVLGDILTGFLALYFVDVLGTGLATAALAVIVWTAAGLVGDALLVPLLHRVTGLRWLRASALLACAVVPAFLLAPGLLAKLVLLAAMGLLRAGWYAIPQSRLYGELPSAGGVVLAISNLATVSAGLIPAALGLLAAHAGLARALWLCALAPPALLLAMRGATNA